MNYKHGVAKVKSCVALVSRQDEASVTTLVQLGEIPSLVLEIE
jgi:hypothetical protein